MKKTASILLVALMPLVGPQLAAQQVQKKLAAQGMGLMQALADPGIVGELGITDDQRMKVRQVVRANRQSLVDARQSATKAESELELALGADQVEEARANAAITALAAARSDATRVVAQVALQIRQILTAEQWRQLQIIARRRGRLLNIP